MVELKHWTDKDDAIIREMAAQGASAKAIGHVVGASRNAVIGRAHREAIPLFGSSVEVESVAQRRARRERARRLQNLRRVRQRMNKGPAMQRVTRSARWQPGVNLEPEPLPIQPAEDVARVSFDNLDRDGARHCRWPVGDPREPGFGFCGCNKMLGQPYCKPHMDRACSVRPAAPLVLPTAGRTRDLVDA